MVWHSWRCAGGEVLRPEPPTRVPLSGCSGHEPHCHVKSVQGGPSKLTPRSTAEANKDREQDAGR